LSVACDALDRYADLARNAPDRLKAAPEIAAEIIREAWEALGRITGERGIDRLLDVIFSEFCLGK
jgi:tRNA modification GTPase